MIPAPGSRTPTAILVVRADLRELWILRILIGLPTVVYGALWATGVQKAWVVFRRGPELVDTGLFSLVLVALCILLWLPAELFVRRSYLSWDGKVLVCRHFRTRRIGAQEIRRVTCETTRRGYVYLNVERRDGQREKMWAPRKEGCADLATAISGEVGTAPD
ncbi:MAG: hypothetical protein ACYDBQ_02125 [Thermoplasmatota archaeon]